MNTAQITKAFNTTIQEFVSRRAEYVLNPDRDFTRNRKLTLDTLIRMLLQMKGSSINRELERFFHYDTNLPTASAFVQQRQKLKADIFEDMFHSFNDKCTDVEKICGYRLFAIDGTDLNLPRDPQADTYIAGSNHEGYNLLHANLFFDILNKTYLDCVLQPRPKADERDAFIQMLTRNTFYGKNIIITDRGYESYNLFAHCINTPHIDFVCRVRQGTGGLRIVQNLPMQELDKYVEFEITTTQKNEDKRKHRIHLCNGSTKGKTLSPKTTVHRWDHPSPYAMKLRVVRFRIANKPDAFGNIDGNPENYETLITTLSPKDFSVHDMKELYHLRWGIETSFRELKYAIGLSYLHSKNENSIRQEIYAHLLMYNFSQRIIRLAVVAQHTGNQYLYQVNFTQAFHLCRQFFVGCISLQNILQKIAQYVLPIRPGRTDKRKLYPKSFVSFLYRVAA